MERIRLKKKTIRGRKSFGTVPLTSWHSTFSYPPPPSSHIHTVITYCYSTFSQNAFFLVEYCSFLPLRESMWRTGVYPEFWHSNIKQFR